MPKEMLYFDSAAIISTASVVGKCEREGPLGECFDLSDTSDKFGKKTWEQAESEMQRLAFNTALAKLRAEERSIDAIFAGDLQNPCVGSCGLPVGCLEGWWCPVGVWRRPPEAAPSPLPPFAASPCAARCGWLPCRGCSAAALAALLGVRVCSPFGVPVRFGVAPSLPIVNLQTYTNTNGNCHL